jgi:hypothetical protein
MLYKEDWDGVRRRFEALWQNEIVDRCCVAVKAPKKGLARRAVDGFVKPASHEELVRWHRDPEWVLERNIADFESTFHGGEALPVALPNWGDSGYALYCNYSCRYSPDTLWFFPTLHDWERDSPRFDPGGELLAEHRRFIAFLAEQGRGKFFVSTPDFLGNVDALINLRGVENTLLGMIDHPERFREEVRFMGGVVRTAAGSFFEIIRETDLGGSALPNFNTWSPGRHNLVQCDFSAMISPEMFERLVLPDLEETCRWLDCALYHIDGEEQVRHLDLILSVKSIRILQWTNVAGRPPVFHYLPVLRRIQQSGKGLLLFCTADQVERLIGELSPRGLFLNVSPMASQEEAEDLIRQVARWTRAKLRSAF